MSKGIEVGSLYDINKALIARDYLTLTREEVFQEGTKVLRKWYTENFLTEYFALLCREIYSFTVIKTDSSLITEAVHETLDCLDSFGEVMSVHDNGNNAIEIWIKQDEEIYCYFLFPYDQGVIDVKKGEANE